MSRESFLTDEEVQWIQSMNRDSPYMIKGVSESQFSPARHYGGMKFNGSSYIYCPNTDEMVRDDVLKAVMKERRRVAKEQKKQKSVADVKQPTLFDV